MKPIVITIRIKVSFHTYSKPTPFSIMFFRIIINHLGGIRLLIICKGNGIFRMGKIKPESIMVGSIKANIEIIMATCWLLDIVDIKIPMDKAKKMKRRHSDISKVKLPKNWNPKYEIAHAYNDQCIDK